MSINPELMSHVDSDQLRPILKSDERILLTRGFVKFQLKSSNEKFQGYGSVIVTTNRIVLIRTGDIDKPSNFVSLELPLCNIDKVEFHQPILFPSYIEGIVKPTPNAMYSLPSISSWWISFYKGGCCTFIKCFFRIYRSVVHTQNVNDAKSKSLFEFLYLK
ncbi:uncharacterized protein CMU_027870 [Cryptosporidium muris RN66]|uniref:GRAM domain-containing protein n=1 Tax=Cryptosporidium muris (strain RN66) TaxID=441375 RepID=B6ABM5_CRYMR|nr:uncharacterized protein CMU_027870 [Cryptosporidium muris RN66]EEA05777.1 hypothetical protein, conserved [Cryptosporidium muris RN66]|eukprot:XP_002140126.1 hypothetical protein [Cryptosporidium muris RN66]